MFLTPTKKKKKKDFVSDWRRREILTLKMLLSLKLWSLRCPHWHQKYQIYYLWLDTVEKIWGNPNQRVAVTQVQSVRFSLRAFLAALVYIYIYFGWIKRMRKILLLLLKTCTCSALMHRYWRERVLKAKRWEIRKKVNEETGTELLIIQGVDVRFQNIWQVEYQRVNRGVHGSVRVGFVPNPEPTRISRVG